jgi:uncharacterized protein
LKKPRRRFFHLLFWLVVLLGIVWFVFVPKPKPHHHEPHQVEVIAVPETPILAGEEHTVEPIGTNALPPDVPPTVQPTNLPKPVTVPKGQAHIAIVIDDVGLDMSGSRRAVALPAAVTLSYIPYATRLHEQTKQASDAGHELLLHVPMEPIGHADPGPDALLTGLSADELRQRLDTALASFTGFDGMNNHMGSKFTSDRAGMELVIDELLPRHIFFLDSRTSSQSVAAAVAAERGLPHISRDVFLDDDMSAKAVRIQLEQTERVARKKGYAVAIGHPHTVTLQALEEWIPDAEQRGFTFVPLNSLVNQVGQ